MGAYGRGSITSATARNGYQQGMELKDAKPTHMHSGSGDDSESDSIDGEDLYRMS